MPRRKAVTTEPGAASVEWRVIVSKGSARAEVAFFREESARHYAAHAERAGVWIGNAFISDAQVEVVAPGA